MLQEGSAVGESRGSRSRKWRFQPALKNRLPVLSKPVVENRRWRDKVFFPSMLFPPAGCSSTSISPGSATAASVPSKGRYANAASTCRRITIVNKKIQGTRVCPKPILRRGYSLYANGCIHRLAYGAVRYTQMAAGSLKPARTPTSRRSISGTKRPVLAPATVGTRARRAYLASSALKTSIKPAPQVRRRV